MNLYLGTCNLQRLIRGVFQEPMDVPPHCFFILELRRPTQQPARFLGINEPPLEIPLPVLDKCNGRLFPQDFLERLHNLQDADSFLPI